MHSRGLAAGIALAWAAAPAAQAVEIPLRVQDATPRAVWVRFESSFDLSAVGQSFGPAWPATWSVSGGIGRVEISASAYGEARAQQEGLGFVSIYSEPFVVEIDLATLEATSLANYGALENEPLSMSFDTRPLDTTATAGFVTTMPLYCTSQADIALYCQFDPSLCDETCQIVPGAPYDPASGKLNLVGREDVQGCDGGFPCFGPFPYFARVGDLQLTETYVPSVPAASAPGRVALALLLAASAAAALRARRAA
jgi:hypothetical protein